MHDYTYYLGFTEDNYNLQLTNRGHGGVGGDAEVGNAQAGALTGGQPDRTSVATTPTRSRSTTAFPASPTSTSSSRSPASFYSPCTDGALDMSIVGHEYTHAISNRMIGGPDDGITSEQGGAMGESWGDLNAAEHMFGNGYSNGASPWVVGPYATGNATAGIRDYAIDENPLNYSDYGFDTTGPEVHADGEIWNGTQWEVRQALVDEVEQQVPVRRQGAPEGAARRVRGAEPAAGRRSARATGAGSSSSSTRSCSSRARPRCSTPATR